MNRIFKVMKRCSHVVLLLVVLLVVACGKEDPTPQGGSSSGSSCYPATGVRVLIANEGNFMFGNGSLSIYAPASNQVYQEVYRCINDDLPLGDVVQSITADENFYYVVVNNSGKVVVLDKQNLELVASWTGMNSPRYAQLVSSTQAYVSDLYADGIHVWNPSNTGYVDFIPTSGWTEKMVWHQATSQVLVTQPDPGKLLLLDPSTNSISDSLTLTKGAGEIVVDDNDHVWVLCSGGYQTEIPALYHFDETLTPVDTFAFTTINESPGALQYANDQLYFLNGDIYAMEVTASQLPSSSLVAAGSRLFYGMGVSGQGEIYVSDAVDYVQDGIVYVYNPQGTETASFEVGVIPGFFFFE